MAEIDAVDIAISGSDGSLCFTVYYDREAESDMTWLRCHCTCDIGAFKGDFNFMITDFDLKSLSAELESLTIGTAQCAEVGNLEDDFQLALSLQKTGAVTVKGKLSPRIANFAVLEFSFDSDLATLDNAVRDVRKALRLLAAPSDVR
jgi:hypothetical protein